MPIRLARIGVPAGAEPAVGVHERHAPAKGGPKAARHRLYTRRVAAAAVQAKDLERRRLAGRRR